MDYTSAPNLVLLARVLGTRQAKRLYRGKLTPLFTWQGEPSPHTDKLVAARELVRRSLEEELVRGDMLNSPLAVRSYLQLLFLGEEREVFAALFVDAQNRLIAGEKLFFGTLSQTSVYPREVVKRALQLNAAAVLFSHNHPSGSGEPSRADELLTRALKDALALVDVRVLDHFVVAGNSAVSFAERGLI
jgi:DNA repair protein RadC